MTDPPCNTNKMRKEPREMKYRCQMAASLFKMPNLSRRWECMHELQLTTQVNLEFPCLCKLSSCHLWIIYIFFELFIWNMHTECKMRTKIIFLTRSMMNNFVILSFPNLEHMLIGIIKLTLTQTQFCWEIEDNVMFILMCRSLKNQKQYVISAPACRILH